MSTPIARTRRNALPPAKLVPARVKFLKGNNPIAFIDIRLVIRDLPRKSEDRCSFDSEWQREFAAHKLADEVPQFTSTEAIRK